MKSYKLSKSKIMSGIQCPKRLYLEVHQPELAEETPGLLQIFSFGHQVGEIARQLHPGGKLIEHDEDLSSALKETRILLNKYPETPLFEATFAHNGVLIRADVLRKSDKGYQMTEVKAATEFKDYYLLDCAVQSWVIEGEGYPLERIELAHVDNTFVYSGDGNYHGLLLYKDITETVRFTQQEVPKWVDQFQSLLKGEIPEIEVGSQCSVPFECPFQHYCFPELPEYPVTALPRGGKIAAELLAEGIQDIRDIPKGRLEKPLHERVRRITVSGIPELDPQAGKYLLSLPYPRYYLDFETIQFAVPIWAGTRPYQQIPFQWSCHIEDKPNNLHHAEFLDINGETPMRLLAKKLLDTLGKKGPIFAYSAFEKTTLNGLAVMFPDISDDLKRLKDRLVDLLSLARKYYYHPEMKGSWSIKAILPTVAPELNYEDLEEVQDGMAAQSAYLEAISPMSPESRRKELKTRLLEYCKMDTLAMVKFVQFFQERAVRE